MSWFFVVLISAALYGWSSVLDNYLADKLFPKTIVLVFASFFFTLPLLPIVAIIEAPSLPPLSVLPFFIIIGVIEVLYLYPYYKALQNEDTAVVGSLFSLGKIFVPVLAFLIVGEVVRWEQYLGFFIVLGSSALLTMHNSHHHIKINKAFFYMIVVSILISLEVVIYKYILADVSWSTGYIGAVLISVLMALPILLVTGWRHEIIAAVKSGSGKFKWLFLEETVSVGANALAVYAISLAPATLVSGAFSVHPFIVMIYAILFSRFFPHFFKEHIDRHSIFKKSLLFATTAMGLVLIAVP